MWSIYPRDMNIYGDFGNTLTLKQRLSWQGYQPIVIDYNPGDSFPENVDIIVGGGGQDSGQTKIKDDLLTIGDRLKELADKNTPMLMVCGLYQLFGHSFKTAEGVTIEGIGLLDVETYARPERLIGNITTTSKDFGAIIGYENHSGQTFLGKNATALANVRIGAGNNTKDTTEGARYKNVIGTYLHGSLLPKNPAIADHLITIAVTNKYGSLESVPINDSFALHARSVATTRPR
jgi:CobQ-like glutamine amidotransferase family enzyme